MLSALSFRYWEWTTSLVVHFQTSRNRLTFKPSPRISQRAGTNRDGLLGRLRQAEERHISIERFIAPRFDGVGFVPNSDIAVVADFAGESLPSGQMRIVFAAGEAFQVFKGSPVGNHDGRQRE